MAPQTTKSLPHNAEDPSPLLTLDCTELEIQNGRQTSNILGLGLTCCSENCIAIRKVQAWKALTWMTKNGSFSMKPELKKRFFLHS